MNNLYFLFKKYANSNSKNEKRFTKGIVLGGERITADELLFLYRQARIYNIEKELSFVKDSDKYKQKREGVINFFNKFGIKFADEERNLFFKYNESKDCFEFDYFITIYAQYTIHNDELIWLFVDEAIRLFDVYSLQFFSVALVMKARKDGLQIPSFINSVLINLQTDNSDLENGLLAYARDNKKPDTDAEGILRSKYLNAIYINKYFSAKSKSFLVLADDLIYNLSSSSFADYSVVSLQYYKVIETELKNKFIKEATKNIEWGKLYVGKKYYKMSDFDCSLMTLGEISKIFEDAYNYIENYSVLFEDSINDKVYKNLYKLCLNNSGFIALFRDITSDIFRQTFRNPPAHTEPLAEEFIPLVETIFYIFVDNLTNIYVKKNVVHRGKTIDALLELNK